MEKTSSLEYAEMRSDLSALRGDINNLDTLVSRLDVAIDKISDVSTNINRLLAVHDNKLENHTRLIDQLASAADQRRDKDDKRSQEILDKISQIREDMRTSISTSNKEISDRFDGKIESVIKDNDSLKSDIAAIQKWKWLVTGGAMIAGWLISKIGWAVSLL